MSFTSGPTNESIFTIPIHDFDRAVEGELPQLFKKVEHLHDHRLLSIVTALIVENRVDQILQAFCPRYNCLFEQGAFTFSLKIRMLEALCLIPQSITEAAHTIRLIRNDFAHNLNLTHFNDIGKKNIQKMQSALKRAKYDKIPATNDPLLEQFKKLSFMAIVGIDCYVSNFKFYREYISDPNIVRDFQSRLQKRLDVEMDQAIKESKIRGIVSITRNGKKWQINYDRISEIVDNLPDGISLPDESL